MTAHVLQWVLSELASQRCVVMATVLNTSGSVPGKPALDWRCRPTNKRGSEPLAVQALNIVSSNVAGNCLTSLATLC